MFNIQRSWLRRQEKNYEYWFWFIDMHGTLFANNYVRGSFGGPFYEESLRPLQFLTKLREAKLILWTSSYDQVIQGALADLDARGIKFDFINENPLVVNDDLCDFGKKPYFDVLLDDKAGFDPTADWPGIDRELSNLFGEHYPK